MSAVILAEDKMARGGYPAGGYPNPTAGGYPARTSQRLAGGSQGSLGISQNGHPMSGASSTAPQPGPVLRKKLFDQNVSDWSSRYRKNKQSLDNLTRDCELLHLEVSKQQATVDSQAASFAQLEDRFQNEAMRKYTETKTALEVASQTKAQIQHEMSENRKLKAQLTRERKTVNADYERKHAELARGAEKRDQLEVQLGMLSQQLQAVQGERERMTRELDIVQHNLRQHTELADEAHHEMERTCYGIKDSVDNKMYPSLRLEASLGLNSEGARGVLEEDGVN
eukprot:TRINITY_DN97154_c0_g1_i1.p1 TRINITY_DN97154_c0_g1~~TRINITY_DN97154_c0_g1_i1.p1  ORF type:complete len:282 (+),score=51.96 TRINITY_DN97154_c0_g1_i1:148-993(+)